LRLMAGILVATEGRMAVRGWVSPMIELGVGFHPDLTGRENIYLNTSLYGLSTAETDAILGEIVAFSELGDFIDVPVKNYSTGMYARLGFAIAANLDADILLVDEVLAVGDGAFQRKCLERTAEIRRRGRTIVLVSHDLDIVTQMADRAVLLVRGRLEAEGEPAKVVRQYREILGIA
jgi:ABC-2 type transport system ATP-binding protein